MCKGCPFNFTEESEYAQNMGCLPSPADILEQHKAHGKNWACHESLKLCKGFVRKAKNVDLSAGLFFEVGVHSNIDYSLNRKQ